MKPSDCIQMIGDLREEYLAHDARIDELEGEIAREKRIAMGKRDVCAAALSAIDENKPWSTVEAILEPYNGKTPEPEVAAPATRKPRADKGVSRTKKPHVEPVKSPLTPELRAKLEQTLAHGPLQLAEITKMSWTEGLDIEELLHKDPKSFVQWLDGGEGGPVVWGTTERFTKAVEQRGHLGPKDRRAEFTSSALGCSFAAARDAWARLDPAS